MKTSWNKLSMRWRGDIFKGKVPGETAFFDGGTGGGIVVQGGFPSSTVCGGGVGGAGEEVWGVLPRGGPGVGDPDVVPGENDGGSQGAGRKILAGGGESLAKDGTVMVPASAASIKQQDRIGWLLPVLTADAMVRNA